ncbi:MULTISPECIES: helix-turn-helix domain-containing protein [unclassified Streptomyces]|uniref:helix-turn-helix domain-containing protein n=1 Tax=unclassified Streptomyces TaxID=2593676 RepID=UPI002E2AC848|nr:hypothetical protein [Streptomyces sp. NBC_00228]
MNAPARRPYLRVGRGRAEIALALRTEYEQGTTVVELAEQHDISRSTVQRLLGEAGTAMRPQVVRPPVFRPATPEDLDRLVDEWLDGRP